MDEKAAEARRAYKREWQRKNRDKCRKYQENYWQKKAEQAAKEAGPDTLQETAPDAHE